MPSRNDKRGERGVALLMALFLLAALSIGTTAAWQFMNRTFDEGRRFQHGQKTLLLAEAGLEKAVAELRNDPAYAGDKDVPLGEGRFTVCVTRRQGTIFSLESFGRLGDPKHETFRATLEATLRLGPGGRVEEFQWWPKKR